MPGMSIPGMPPASAVVGELTAVSPEPWSIPDIPDIPAMLDELDLDATITNPTTALATASTTAAITIWLVPVLRVIEKVPKIVVSCRGHEEDPLAQVSTLTVDFPPLDFPGGFDESLVKARRRWLKRVGVVAQAAVLQGDEGVLTMGTSCWGRGLLVTVCRLRLSVPTLERGRRTTASSRRHQRGGVTG